MGRIGMPEIIIVALVIILLFGARKLPELAASLAKAIKEFKRAGKEIDKDIKEGVSDHNDEKKV